MDPGTNPASGEPDDRLETIVARCIESVETEGDAAVERACLEHPKHANAIRSVVAHLKDEGLLGAKPAAKPAASAVKSAAAAPRRLGDFEILREIGRGGMGVVYEAMQVSLKRVVALKVLPSSRTLDARAVERFQREAVTAAKLRHPGIVEVYAVGTEDGLHYFAMELIRGTPLDELIARLQSDSKLAGAASWTKAQVGVSVRLAAAVADALEFAHGQGVVHRDVKPSNILLREDGTPVLTDFGLAREQGLPSLTQTGEFAGTPFYVSPEQAMARRVKVDHRTDLFSLGVTLYELLTLRRPFEGETSQAVLQHVLTKAPPDPAKINPRLVADVGTIVLKALEKDPDQRYESAAAMAADLRAFLEYRPIAARRASLGARVVRWARRERAKAALAAVVLLGAPLLFALGGYIVAKQPLIVAAAERAHFDRVERALEDGFRWIDDDRPRALARFHDALALEPKSPEAIAGICFSLREPSRQIAVLDRHADVEEKHPALSRIRARALRDMQLETEASALERKLGEPKGALDLFVAGKTAMPIECLTAPPEEFAKPIAWLGEAVAASPSARFLFHAEWAHAAGHARNAAEAHKVAGAIEALWPRSPQAWSSIALALGRVDPAAAAAAHRRALEMDPRNALTHDRYADALHDAGDFKNAIVEFRRALELDPTLRMTHQKLGDSLARTGDFTGAIAEYRLAIERDPFAPFPHNNLGHALLKVGDVPGAIVEFRRALELDPRDAVAHYNLGKTLHESGDLEGGMTEYRRAIELDPKANRPVLNLGNALLQSGDAQGAVVEYRRAIELDPRQAITHFNLAVALDALENPIAAIESVRRAIELDPDVAAFHNNLGALLNKTDDASGALAAYRRAFEIEPTSAIVALNFGSALQASGDFDGAIEAFRAALAIDPASALAQAGLQDAEQALEARAASASASAPAR